jgi:hypothetical protein
MISNKIEDVINPIKGTRVVRERKTIFTVNSISREEYEYIELPKNPYTNLYSSDYIDSSDNVINIVYTAEILNNLTFDTSEIINPYIQKGEKIYQKIFKYKSPNKYTVELTKKFINIKSLRLLSVEIPNTINNITCDNNIIILDIVDSSNNSIPLKPDKSPFSYIIFQLDVGSYLIDDFIIYFENKLNNIVNDYNDIGLIDIFKITYVKETGEITINLININYKFHLKFWYNNNETFNLWYMLGFSYYHELNVDGTDKYDTFRTNLKKTCINHNLNISDFYIYKPFRKPNMDQIKYIYLPIK